MILLQSLLTFAFVSRALFKIERFKLAAAATKTDYKFIMLGPRIQAKNGRTYFSTTAQFFQTRLLKLL